MNNSISGFDEIHTPSTNKRVDPGMIEFVRSKYIVFPELKAIFERGNAMKYFVRVLQDTRTTAIELTKPQVDLIREIFRSGHFDFSWHTDESKFTTFKFRGLYPELNFKIKFCYR